MEITNIRVYSQVRGQFVLEAPRGILNNAGPIDIGIPDADALLFNGGPYPQAGPFNIEYYYGGFFQSISLQNYQFVGGAAHHFN